MPFGRSTSCHFEGVPRLRNLILGRIVLAYSIPTLSLYPMFYKYIVYITTNANKSTLYIGITNNIQRRLAQHFADSIGGKYSFAGKYNCYYLVYYEVFEQITEAILREKQIKKWNRMKKEILIASLNPEWHFLNNEIF